MTESPSGFDQAFPGGVVDCAGQRKAARALEGLDQGKRAVSEGLLGVVRREVSEGGEALV
jgi:hypothetical protein